MAIGGLAAVLVLTGTAAAKPSSGDKHAGPPGPALTTTDNAPVELAPRPGSEADRLARQLMAPDIEKARAYGEDPLVLVGMARLNDEDELLLVQLQSQAECGSAGCNTVSFRYNDGRWVKVMDTVGGSMWIARTTHGRPPRLIVQPG